MGHIMIKDLRKEFLERRTFSRNGNSSGHGLNVVIDSLNLEFHSGEMVCILGPSGCGKTTLLRIIAGFEKPSSGKVLINGKAVETPSSEHIFVFQNSSLLPWMTVWENVELGLRHMKDKEQMNDTIQEHIDMVELDGFENNYPHQLSGGMQRRAELARALAVNPDVLFMDEPLTGLDFLTHMKMREEIVNMHQFIGKTVIFITHNIDDALIMGDRIVVLSKRPSQVVLEKKLHFSRPRDFRKDPELGKFRDEVFLMLGVNSAI